MKPLSTNIYTFSDLIGEGCLYVDKTRYLLDLVETPKGQFFLSRPRRFGKSLMLTTLKAIFQGKRELFEGLHIATADYDWPVHPVIHLNMGSVAASTAAELETGLSFTMRQEAANHGVVLHEKAASLQFLELVSSLHAVAGRVVILIDEYDKPILGNADNLEKIPEILKALKAFYSVIKTTESDQRFAMLTGVSKFSRVSIFSDLNNLTDLTMDADYATMLGYTQEELESNFADYIEKVQQDEGLSREALLAKLRDWYNGYRFHQRAASVYNPVSSMSLFRSGEFRNYWFETGTPTMLLHMLRDHGSDIQQLEGMVLPELAFSAYEIENMQPAPLLFQTGYLTIKDYDPESGFYTLGYPNREVRDAFLQYLADTFTPVKKERATPEAYAMLTALRAGDVDAFMGHLKPFFAGIDYDLHIPQEKYYQTVFYLIIRLIGIYVRTEVKTNTGRMDAVIELPDHIYIFEFKLDGTAQQALAQINAKAYYERFLPSGKPITLVGTNFDAEARNVTEWKVGVAVA
jgi:hypothetical protein